MVRLGIRPTRVHVLAAFFACIRRRPIVVEKHFNLHEADAG